MTVWGGREVAAFIRQRKAISSDQIQPAGIDLTLKNSQSFSNTEYVFDPNQDTPEDMVDDQIEDGCLIMHQGAHLLHYCEEIRIPETAVGVVFPRSTLMRHGVMVFSALWDPGYCGFGKSLALVTRNRVKLPQKMRVAQLVFYTARPSGKYRGLHQSEKR